ncbi:hypothetical protein EON63_09700 [archaeon]|nr:MAG: hypothetical protein EON63_09700 [archaeon]
MYVQIHTHTQRMCDFVYLQFLHQLVSTSILMCVLFMHIHIHMHIHMQCPSLVSLNVHMSHVRTHVVHTYIM